jgi:hypothetical protein
VRGVALGSLPDVPVVELLDLISTKLVHGREEDRATVHKPPFSNAVPVQFARGALLEMLLSGRDVVTLRKVLDDLLANPA